VTAGDDARSVALNDADVTPPACPLSVRISAPLLASQTFAVPSRLLVTTRDPSELNDAEKASTWIVSRSELQRRST